MGISEHSRRIYLGCPNTGSLQSLAVLLTVFISNCLSVTLVEIIDLCRFVKAQQ